MLALAASGVVPAAVVARRSALTALPVAAAARQPTLAALSALAATALCLLTSVGASAEQIYRGHALGIHDEIKYGADFRHFDYVNPDAPKGGELRLARTGTFDSLNPFILKGLAAQGSTFIYNRLCTKSLDEPLTEYGELAESIECPADRSWVAFTLRPEARWHDGKPITADDVVFTFETLISDGTPFYRSFYADVTSVEATDSLRVKFTFANGDNRELPLILGQLRILPRHYWEGREFSKTTLDPPLGSGPYRIDAVDPGRSITYRRVPGNWDEALPVQVGQHNFDVIRYDYYRDETVAIEALKAGEYDFRAGSSAREWSTAYDLDAVTDGRLVKEMVPHQLIRGMSGFVFNTRRGKFADPRIRRALALAFDFEWTNANLFYGLFTRTTSYFENSELAAPGTVPDGLELAILEPYRDRLPAEVFDEIYTAPSTDTATSLRQNLRLARRMLVDAGWRIRDGRLTNGESGEVMTIEFLLVRPSYERVIGAFQDHLRRLGIDSRIRTVDSAQYWNRVQEFDYDIIARSWNQYQSPGNEQRNYWTSTAARSPGSRNYPGIGDPVVDDLVERLIIAQDRRTQVATAQALDRVLLWGHYLVPHWHSRNYRLIYWDKFGRPETLPRNGLGFPATWWIDPLKFSRLQRSGNAR
jgi:microcin C transport system substrate-binding protein